MPAADRYDGPFVSCEDALPPMFGQHNFHAVLTSVPLLAVPLYSLALACGVRAQPTATAQLTKALLLCFLLSLTVLFCTNLHQHMVGGHLSFRLHDAMAAVQAMWNASMLNTLSRRAGLRASIGERAGLVLAVCGTAAVAAASSGEGLDWQEPVWDGSGKYVVDRCTPLCLVGSSMSRYCACSESCGSCVPFACSLTYLRCRP